MAQLTQQSGPSSGKLVVIIATGVVVGGLVLAGIFWAIDSFRGIPERGSPGAACRAHLRSIGTACELYACDYQVYPPDLGYLVKYCDLNPNILVCPATDTKAPRSKNIDELAAWASKNSDYAYLGAGCRRGDSANILLYEKKPAHAIGRDGEPKVFAADERWQVEAYTVSALEKILKDQASEARPPVK